MTVKEFIENNRNKDFDIHELLKRTYIPFVEKLQMINSIIEVMTYENHGILNYDTNELEMNKDIIFIKAYTNLDFENGVTDYDLLTESGLIQSLYNENDTVMGKDLLKLNDMFKQKLCDLMRTHNSLESVVNRNLNKVADALIESIDQVNAKLKETDIKKLNTTLTKGFMDIAGFMKKSE